MICGQGGDPDNATGLDRGMFRVFTGVLGAGLAVCSAITLARGLMGNPERLAMAGVGLFGLVASVWYWRRMDRRMTRAIDARRTDMPHRRFMVGAREMVVETTPLEAPQTAKTLHRAGRQLLVLKPSLGIRLFALAFILFGVTLVYVLSTDRGKTGNSEPLGPYWGALSASPFLVEGLLMLVLPCRVEFDRAAGCMRTCRLGSRQGRLLREVLAIQRIKGRPRQAQQLNLVLDGDPPRRMSLTSHRNGEAMRATGAALAEFLGVPLLEEPVGEKTEKG